MKIILLTSILLLLTSCSPRTKKEALDYYMDITFEESLDIMSRLDEQYIAVNEYFSNPKKLTEGPSTEEFEVLLNEQKKLVPDIEKCIKSLAKIDRLGDDAEYLENLSIYLSYRLNFERDVMTRLVKSLENGMTNEESSFLQTRFTQLFDLRKQEDKFYQRESDFLKEFQISDDDIDKELTKRGF